MTGKMNKRIFALTILVLMALAVSACGGTTPADSGSTDMPAAETAPATEAAAAVGSCPVGSWLLTDFSGYMASIMNNLNSNSSDIVVTDQGFTGTATFTFDADGTSSLAAENFQETFTVSVGAGGTTFDIPIILTINGTSTADYSISGDELTFSNQDAGDQVITMDMNGTTSTLDEGMMGAPDTVKLYQFACPDADSLSLKVVAVTDMDLAPLLLTRVQ